MLMAKWWIGCSGFHYKHWKGAFYPEKLAQNKWFGFYAEHFKTFELNVTFYRFPRLSVLEPWYNNTPDNFRFSVKAPKAITHFKKFNDTQRMVNDFYGTSREGLKEKLGPILFQLPPILTYKEENLEKILDNLDPSFTNVLEFRHESWWNAEVYNKLAQHNITFCGMSHPKLPDEVIQNTKVVYFRFHGIPHLYASPYDLHTLQKIANEIEENSSVKEAFIYFNNDINASAIKNALDMDQYVSHFRNPNN
jgi:uncharacterized protein YecE (DUF72 family)